MTSWAGGPASLREDYLSQVQRDCLSRAQHATQHPQRKRQKRSNPDFRAKKKPAKGGLIRIHQILDRGQSNTGLSTPSTLCSLGLVVVYCKCTFLSGKIKGMAPKAASAHSWNPERMSFFLPG